MARGLGRWVMTLSVVAAMIVGPFAVQSASALLEEDRIVFSAGCDEPPESLNIQLLDPSGFTTSSTTTEGAWGASVSADGSQIVVGTVDGLVVTDPDGTGAEPVAGTADAQFPVWSPDGTRIAFARSGRLYIVGYEPYTAPTPVTEPDTVGTNHLDWSPDGSTLLWSTGTVDYVIETVAVSDGTRTEIATGRRARYATDGTWIAFTAEPTRNLAKMDADGSNVVVTLQPGTAGGVLGDEVAFRDRRVINGLLTDYIGTYSFGSAETTVVLDGDAVTCDTNFYVWDWGHLKLPTFGDTAYDDLFFADIEWLGEQGITKGCNPPVNDLFCPRGILTRGQIAAFLVRALGLPPGDPDVFVDDDNSIFESDIDRLAAAGITKGCNPPDNDRFCPGEYVTRGQIAAFLVRAFGYVDDGGGDLFVDDDNSIFEHDIDRLAAAGVTKGCNPPANDMYCPANLINREQFAAMLHRALA
ncbi:MAG: hypothetical protein PVG83_03795 [Acidimicrobiia bacterium]